MKHGSLTNALLLTIIVLCTSSAAAAKDLSVRKHLKIGKDILNRLNAGDSKSAPELKTAMQYALTHLAAIFRRG